LLGRLVAEQRSVDPTYLHLVAAAGEDLDVPLADVELEAEQRAGDRVGGRAAVRGGRPERRHRHRGSDEYGRRGADQQGPARETPTQPALVGALRVRNGVVGSHQSRVILPPRNRKRPDYNCTKAPLAV
jgi:hypothetical protein